MRRFGVSCSRSSADSHTDMPSAAPWDDESLWITASSRFDNSLARDIMRNLMRDYLTSLPANDPARRLWAALPQARGWEINLNEPN